jgi:mRNA interferase RelE/StbE
MIEQVNEHLASIRIRVRFTRYAQKDFKAYSKGQQAEIMVLIVKQAEKNPRMRPHGNGKPLGEDLVGLCKIKSKATGLRVIYRPIEEEDGMVTMEIIAIGPRDRNEVYRKTSQRLK